MVWCSIHGSAILGPDFRDDMLTEVRCRNILETTRHFVSRFRFYIQQDGHLVLRTSHHWNFSCGTVWNPLVCGNWPHGCIRAPCTVVPAKWRRLCCSIRRHIHTCEQQGGQHLTTVGCCERFLFTTALNAVISFIITVSCYTWLFVTPTPQETYPPFVPISPEQHRRNFLLLRYKKRSGIWTRPK
jgi:hypothetical protein